MNNIMFFKVANHNLTVVGSDASYTKHINSDYIAISPGQTIDVLLHANQAPNHYYMASRPFNSANDSFSRKITTGFVIYKGQYPPPSPPPPLPNLPDYSDVNANNGFTKKLRSLHRPTDLPLKIDTKLFFTLSINADPCPNCTGPVKGGRLMASVNNITMQPFPKMDILQAYSVNASGFYESNFPDNPPFVYNYTAQNVPRELRRPEKAVKVKILEFNSTVEIVFQGTNTVSGVEHPMHLHGHSFYVVGSDTGNFDKDKDPAKYNLFDPPLMETIAVPKNGWTAIRFRANNPGVWFMHCHFERHVSWGMGMAFITKDGKGPNEAMLPPPSDMPPC